MRHHDGPAHGPALHTDSVGDIDFKRPPSIHNAAGGMRRVGFELEFSGIALEHAAATVERVFGGRRRTISVAEQEVDVPGLGRFSVELDWSYLKRKASAAGEDSDWVGLLGQAAAVLVPVEIVCPPIPLTELGILHAMTRSLRQAGALGTEESLIAAYGVHINPEAPGRDAATLFAYLRAFALLQWWLVASHDVDPARRVSPYVDRYSEAYSIQLLSRHNPTLDELFDDYLEHNASRNRSLDLLPLLASIDEGKVRRKVADPKIGVRPTFHYRLPNCHIERPDWSLAQSWNRWCVVEALAASPADLDALADAFLRASRPLLGVSRSAWIKRMDAWVRDRGLE